MDEWKHDIFHRDLYIPVVFFFKVAMAKRIGVYVERGIYMTTYGKYYVITNQARAAPLSAGDLGEGAKGGEVVMTYEWQDLLFSRDKLGLKGT